MTIIKSKKKAGERKDGNKKTKKIDDRLFKMLLPERHEFFKLGGLEVEDVPVEVKTAIDKGI